MAERDRLDIKTNSIECVLFNYYRVQKLGVGQGDYVVVQYFTEDYSKMGSLREVAGILLSYCKIENELQLKIAERSDKSDISENTINIQTVLIPQEFLRKKDGRIQTSLFQKRPMPSQAGTQVKVFRNTEIRNTEIMKSMKEK